jgi:hypothetical protein
MRVLFDHGTPAPLRAAFSSHTVSTAHEMGWAELSNGMLLKAADPIFDVFITTDKSIAHQQNLSGLRLAILVLPTTSWPRLRGHAVDIVTAAEKLTPGGLASFGQT